MEFFLNQATNLFVRGLGLNATLSAASFKARDTVVLDVWFHDGSGAGVALEEGALLVFIVKDGLSVGAATYAFADEWTAVDAVDKPGLYRALVSLNTVALIDAIGSLSKISAYGELSWSVDEGATWESSNTLAVTIENDVYKGVEGTPLAEPSPDDWLEARRPAPITRTAAEGPPASGSAAVAGSLVFSAVALADGDAISIADGATILETWTFRNVADAPFEVQLHTLKEDTLYAWAAQLTAGSAYLSATHSGLEGDLSLTLAAKVDLTGLSFYLSDGDLIDSSLMPVAVIPGTPADALDQACIVGDEGGNKLEYRAVQITPFFQWQLVTAGIVWNEDEEQFEKLVVRDGTLQTDVYSLL